MNKTVLLVTGTPCVGKTLVARQLAADLDAAYVNLTDLAAIERLDLGKDEDRNSIIVDEKRMKQRMRRIIKESSKEVAVIDGHYAVNVVPAGLVTRVFVLRRDPVELRKFMMRAGFSDRKLNENMASEILDVCLIDALDAVDKTKICEIDITGKTVQETVQEVKMLLKDPARCAVGVVDWLGKLESEGLLEEYLRI